MQASDIIMKLSKKGTTPSQIGVILRDLHGVGQVTSITGTKILRILRKQGLAPEIPEDLYFLIKKAVSMRKHLDRFKKDRDTKFRLILVESRIHRLARYYKVRADKRCSLESAGAASLRLTPVAGQHRLTRAVHVQQNKKLPPNWKYESATASTLVS